MDTTTAPARHLVLIDARVEECLGPVCDLLGSAGFGIRVQDALTGHTVPHNDVDLVRDALRYLGFRCEVKS